MKALKNWKTTLLGLVAGAHPLAQAWATGDKAGLIQALAIIAMGVFAKDSNVSGQ